MGNLSRITCATVFVTIGVCVVFAGARDSETGHKGDPSVVARVPACYQRGTSVRCTGLGPETLDPQTGVEHLELSTRDWVLTIGNLYRVFPNVKVHETNIHNRFQKFLLMQISAHTWISKAFHRLTIS